MPREYDSDRERERRHRNRERRPSRDEEYARQQRRRRGHRATDSQGDLLPRPSPRYARDSESEWESPSPRRKRESTARGDSTPSGSRGSAPLSLDAIAKLDKANQKKAGWRGYDYDEDYLKEVRRKEAKLERERAKAEKEERRRQREEERAQAEKQKAYESDVAAQEEARLRRERRREERERVPRKGYRRGYTSDEEVRRSYAEDGRERRRGYTDDEREVRRSYAEDGRERRRGYTDDEREVRRSYADDTRGKRRSHTADDRGKRRSHTEDEGPPKRSPMALAWEQSRGHRLQEEAQTPSERDLKREKKLQEKRYRMEQKRRRVVSGPLAEEGGVDDDDEYRYMMEKRGGGYSEPSELPEDELARKKKFKRILIGVVSFLIILAIIIPVAVMMSNKSKEEDSSSTGAGSSSSDGPKNGNLDKIDASTIPADKKGTILDPFSWYDTEDFNVTYTDETVGGLPIMGLNSKWDDDVQANENVPKLSDTFKYGKMPIRGINLGGWLNIEPFITPSFFEKYSQRDGIVDEYTLCSKLGTARCKDELEKHYSTFVTKKTFKEIREAGFDHVRIPFGYWMVETYEGDPYVKQVAWRYLLRAIEWARQNGIRINLDLHGAPGSQNGWNHSGKQGEIGWLNGKDGDLNAQRTLEIHHQMSQFFSQPRYKNIITMYGLVNEPRMVDIDTQSVLAWTDKAIKQIRNDGITAVLVFGDGFFGLDNWQGKLQDDDNLLLDVHQYVIFNIDQLSLKHTDKLNFACRGWTQQSKRSMDKTTGFGPTMCGEWSQADTDCTQYINNVNMGTRWEGTYNTGNASTSILKPQCPSNDQSCTCDGANADVSTYSDVYKKWLYQFAVAQMISFEVGWGWFYWTWDTEKAAQWSWKKGMAAGTLPKKVWDRDFDCPTQLEDFEKLGLEETY